MPEHINPDGTRPGRLLPDGSVEPGEPVGVVPLLHIYSPPFYHQEAFIVGNREGLERLRDALDALLSAGQEKVVSETVFHGDGEGYEVCCARDDSPFGDDAFWNRLSSPYTVDCGEEQHGSEDDDIIYPYSLFR